MPFAALITLLAGLAAPAPVPAVGWTTLGTAGGPVVFAERSQPANLLTVGNDDMLVDCGDGCVERLAAAGVTAAQIDTVFVSHLHQDHVAGLAGLIGLRWMQGAGRPLTIYGPPGTDAMVRSIVQSIEPSARIGLPGGRRSPLALDGMVHVVTLTSGADVTVHSIRVRAVRNTHFDENGVPPDNGTQSLSYRFDIGDAAIGFTGDTGPSDAVTRLFEGVGLIVSEAADLKSAAAAIDAPGSPVPVAARAGLLRHIEDHHLTPEQAGRMAAADHARCLVLTHLSISTPTAEVAPRLTTEAHATFPRQVFVAHDLDRFVVPDAGASCLASPAKAAPAKPS